MVKKCPTLIFARILTVIYLILWLNGHVLFLSDYTREKYEKTKLDYNGSDGPNPEDAFDVRSFSDLPTKILSRTIKLR